MAINNSINNSCLGGITVSGGAVSVNSGTNACGISTDSSNTTVNVGTGTAIKTCTFGSLTSTSTTTVNSGSGGMYLITPDAFMTLRTGTGALDISGDTAATTITIGFATAAKGIVIGSTNTTSYTSLRSGPLGNMTMDSSNGAWEAISGTGTMSMSHDATNTTVNIGTGAGVKTCTFGSNSSTSATTLRSGSGALAITSSNGTITANSGTGVMGISTDASATTVNIATGGAVKTTTLGSTNSTSATTIQAGSGALNITSVGGNITTNSGTGIIGISTDASATTVSIGTGAAVKTITMGSTNTTSTTNLTSGSGGVQVATFIGLPTTSSTVGQIKINGNRVFHSYATENIFVGDLAGNFTTSGTGCNVGVGSHALNGNSTGEYNVGVGRNALNANTTGFQNNGVGNGVLQYLNGGSYNCVTGSDGGANYSSTESSNILINSLGVNGESNTLRFGDSSGTGAKQLSKAFIHGIFGTTVGVSGLPVVIDNVGQLGTVVSSARYKENVQDLGDLTSDVLKLRPVSFTLKAKPEYGVQAGLIAEEVSEIFPGLVSHNLAGEIESVRYHDLPVLLLNELKKAVKRIEDLEQRLSEK